MVLLGGMNWNSQSRDCFACLTIITDYLLVQPLTNITEGRIFTVCVCIMSLVHHTLHTKQKQKAKPWVTMLAW